MKVYIVRHGDIAWLNALKIYNNENEDLNENGVIQAETLKSKSKDLEPYDMIISSPLIRAKHTAEIINLLKMKKILN
ncbi:MAG: histidine phosphatase family protein [Bacilli bacterium]